MFKRFITKHVNFETWYKSIKASGPVGGATGLLYGIKVAATDKKFDSEYAMPDIIDCTMTPFAYAGCGMLIGKIITTFGPIIAPVVGITYGMKTLVNTEAFRNKFDR
jgi:hypothetical protein